MQLETRFWIFLLLSFPVWILIHHRDKLHLRKGRPVNSSNRSEGSQSQLEQLKLKTQLQDIPSEGKVMFNDTGFRPRDIQIHSKSSNSSHQQSVSDSVSSHEAVEQLMLKTQLKDILPGGKDLSNDTGFRPEDFKNNNESINSSRQQVLSNIAIFHEAVEQLMLKTQLKDILPGGKDLSNDTGFRSEDFQNNNESINSSRHKVLSNITIFHDAVEQLKLNTQLRDTSSEGKDLSSDDGRFRPGGTQNNRESSDSSHQQTLSSWVSSDETVDKAVEYVTGRHDGIAPLMFVRMRMGYNSGENHSLLTESLVGSVLQHPEIPGHVGESNVINDDTLLMENSDSKHSVSVRDVTKSSLARDPSHCSNSPCPCRCVEVAWTNRTRDSTCSDYATSRGPGQKVVSFCFYGDIHHERMYFLGIRANAQAVKRLYPGWTMRVYVDVSPGNNEVSRMLCNLQCQYGHLDICYARSIPGYYSLIVTDGMIWRFLPMADPLVDLFLSRDLDSRVSLREKTAVWEWISSGLTFHVMRDHWDHWKVIQGGMWDARVMNDRSMMRSLLRKMLVKGITRAPRYGLDQSILEETVWPRMKGAVLQHDSYYCSNHYMHGHMAPWSTRRTKDEQYNFVGSRIGLDVNTTMKQCPVNCRPFHHRNWITC